MLQKKKKITMFYKTKTRVGYIDDIFAIVDKNVTIKNFHDDLNCQYSTIKLAYEK